MASFSVTLTPTVGTAAYIAGDAVGGNLATTTGIYQFGLGLASTSGGKIEIESVLITDKSKTKPAIFLEFFKAIPASGTYVDGSPLTYGSGDHANKLQPISILAADWIDLPRVSATSSSVAVNDLGMVLAPTGQDLFLLIHADSAFSLTALDWTITVSGRTL